MIAEFLGLPTCGKTTISGALSKELRRSGWSVRNLKVLDEQDRKIRPVLRNNPIARSSYRLDRLRDSHPEFLNILDEISVGFPIQKALILDCLVKQTLCRSHPSQVGLVKFDEGIWHRILAVMSKKQDYDLEKLANLARLAPAIDVLVFIESRPEETIERSVERIHNRTNGSLDRDARYKRAIAAHGTVEDLQERLTMMRAAANNLDKAGTKVVRLRARQPVPEMVDSILTQMAVPDEAGFFA